MVQKIVSDIIGPIVGGFSGYLSLPAYGRSSFQNSMKETKIYTDEKDYWKDAIGPYYFKEPLINRRLHEGDEIELNGFVINEWFPRCPGLYWTTEGFRCRNKAENFVENFLSTNGYKIYNPIGKEFMVFYGGIGTTRLNMHRSSLEDYKVLCATSSGLCDAGIPLILTGDAYSRLGIAYKIMVRLELM